jgi:ribonuclease HI
LEKKLIVYTDGSYKNHKCGYAFLYYFDNADDLPTICYGVFPGKNSTSAEISSVIRAIQYIKTLDIKGYTIEIRTDQLILVNNLNSKIYLEWDKTAWRKSNGKKVVSNISEWSLLCSLLKSDAYNSYIFSKIKSKRGKSSIKVDLYSKIARQLNINKTAFAYIVQNSCGNSQTSRVIPVSYQNSLSITKKPSESHVI